MPGLSSDGRWVLAPCPSEPLLLRPEAANAAVSDNLAPRAPQRLLSEATAHPAWRAIPAVGYLLAALINPGPGWWREGGAAQVLRVFTAVPFLSFLVVYKMIMGLN